MAVSYTAGSVMDLVASLMNDSAKTYFGYSVQLPYLKMAQQELDQQLNLNECPLNLISEYESTVTAGTLSLSLPTSFFLPVSLKERATTSTSEADYVDMTEVANVNDLSLEQTTTLIYWDFRHNCINFVGSTVGRQVRLYYWRQATAVSDSGDILLQAGANNFLAYKTGALVARFIRKQNEIADNLELQAAQALDLLLSVLVKNTQGVRVRRLPFRRSGLGRGINVQIS